MKKKLFLLLLTILLVSPVLGELSAEVETIENSIYLDEQAKFILKLYNPDSSSKVVQIYAPDVRWYVELKPSITRLDRNESVELQLNLIPSVWAEPGSQAVKVFIEAPNRNEKVELELPVFVKSFDIGPIDYSPSVEMRVTFPENINPTDSIKLDVYLRNRNRLDIENLNLYIGSESELLQETRTFPLEPLSERREKFTFEIDPLTEPMQDQLEVMISIGNRPVNRERLTYKIVAYSDFVKQTDTIEELFKTTTEYTVVNEGNIRKRDVFAINTNPLKKLFTNTDPDPTSVRIKEEGRMEWILDLGPAEENTIKVVENYRPIVYLILLGVVIVIIYFLYRSPIIVKKEAVVMGSSSEGISEMKVLLHVRNRSQELMEGIEITDLIPSIAKMEKKSRVGTLSPKKVIRHQKRGTLIKWELDALEPFEERIITYRLKSKIAIVGGFTLPRAKIEFDTEKGKKRVQRSNKTEVSLGL